ncbi:hypothetical protein EOPP23_11910 [Endozoicomonas sp. OPT23]|uniref:hypothetical protein n=1 Tax=Endozoicomonas sp. OPT23 TaxID=2072845 RepID=UPI00129AE2B5|nr:hypothetical protein [Endozoicomonas sp. OPT23]MRI33691.1 hypothetical protein [Endozoicomonas sp. OPT23]
MMKGFDPIKPGGDYFTGRKGIPQISIDKETAMRGRVKRSFAQRLNRWATVIAHPKRAFKQLKTEKTLLREEIKNGWFNNPKDLKDRHASVTTEHMQQVIKNFQKGDSDSAYKDEKLKGELKHAPEWIDAEKELEQVRSVRIGFRDSDPDAMDPKNMAYQKETRKIYSDFMEGQKKADTRNEETLNAFKDLHVRDGEIADLRGRIQQSRDAFYQFKARLEKIPFYRSKETYKARGEKEFKTRDELLALMNECSSQIIEDYQAIEKEMSRRAEVKEHFYDAQKESKETMNDVQQTMLSWWSDHKGQLAEIKSLLGDSEVDTVRSDSDSEIAKRKAIGWVREYRKTDLKALEDKYVELSKTEELRTENSSTLASLSQEIYSGRIAAMRLEEAIRKSESAWDIGKSINEYLEQNQLQAINAQITMSRPPSYNQLPASTSGFNEAEFNKVMKDPLQGLSFNSTQAAFLAKEDDDDVPLLNLSLPPTPPDEPSADDK